MNAEQLPARGLITVPSAVDSRLRVSQVESIFSNCFRAFSPTGIGTILTANPTARFGIPTAGPITEPRHD